MRRVRCFAVAAAVLVGSTAAGPTWNQERPGGSEAAAIAVLERVAKKMIGLRTYQADCETVLMYPATAAKPARERRERSHLDAAKPNRMRYELHRLKRDPRSGSWVVDPRDQGIVFVCDGKTNWKQFGDHYRTDNLTQPEALSTILEPWEGFYSRMASAREQIVQVRREGELKELRTEGSERVDGVLCDKVFAHTKTSFQGESQESWATWYVGRDGLVRRKVERIEFGGKPGYTRDSRLVHIRLNERIPLSRFVYKPRPGVLSEADYEKAHPQPSLLAAGSVAPPFTALDARNRPVRLADFAGKVLVLDFWASWCGPCVASMPHNQQVVSKLQAEGLPVALLAVDNSEPRDAFVDWVHRGEAKFPSITFAHIPPENPVSSKAYHVSGIPTQYVLDRSGIVRASFVGYGGPTDDLEKAIRAALGSKP
jgi:thiol-disulfide isomerase/thioredoxin